MHAMLDRSQQPSEEVLRVTSQDTAPPDDEFLWARVRKGDEAAFREVFTRHNKAVYNFAFRHSASWAVAEEATQTAFVAVWRRAREGTLPRLAGSGVRAWLMGVVRNECRNASRTGVRQLRVVGRVAHHAVHEHDNVDSWLDHESGMQRINEVLSRIPDKQRHVVELVAWAGLSLEETAATLGVPVGTVKSRLHRARHTLATSEVAHLLTGGH